MAREKWEGDFLSLLGHPDMFDEFVPPLPGPDDKPSTWRGDCWIYAGNPNRPPLNRDLSGKWLIFVPWSRVDVVWAVIARETEAGRLGTSAKVATAYMDKEADRVICVYTRDYRDTADVKRIRDALFELGWHAPLSYKTDAQTRAGVSGGIYRY